jgi:L-methionine (R)-S-oxide reductase
VYAPRVLPALPPNSSANDKREHYAGLRAQIEALVGDERDAVAIYATVACELHAAFAAYDWTGFYRRVGPDRLLIGPYQGGHGCLEIAFARGVCGAAARTRETQLVPDVHAFPGHIACSSSTLSEIVVPVLDPSGELLAVLDVDSNLPAAFDAVDQEALESLCAWIGARAAS